MGWLDEDHLGWHRIEAIVRRDDVSGTLLGPECRLKEETEGWLAFLGWTGASFLEEAFPEYYGGDRG
jgi:hypothetical protein